MDTDALADWSDHFELTEADSRAHPVGRAGRWEVEAAQVQSGCSCIKAELVRDLTDGGWSPRSQTDMGPQPKARRAFRHQDRANDQQQGEGEEQPSAAHQQAQEQGRDEYADCDGDSNGGAQMRHGPTRRQASIHTGPGIWPVLYREGESTTLFTFLP